MLEAASTVIVRRENDVYDRIDIRKSFGFRTPRDGSVLHRWFDCWCPACMSAGGPDGGSMDSNYQVKDCKVNERRYGATVALQGNRGLGIGAQRKGAQRKGRELAKQLKPGVAIVVKSRLLDNALNFSALGPPKCMSPKMRCGPKNVCKGACQDTF